MHNSHAILLRHTKEAKYFIWRWSSAIRRLQNTFTLFIFRPLKKLLFPVYFSRLGCGVSTTAGWRATQIKHACCQLVPTPPQKVKLGLSANSQTSWIHSWVSASISDFPLMGSSASLRTYITNGGVQAKKSVLSAKTDRSRAKPYLQFTLNNLLCFSNYHSSKFQDLKTVYSNCSLNWIFTC